MDINVIFNDGEMANIEMQLLNQKDRLNNRIVYYLAQLFLSQLWKRRKTKYNRINQKEVEWCCDGWEKNSQISQEQIDRINQIYDDLWNMEEQWRFDKAMEEKYETGKLEGKAVLIQRMLLKLSIEEVADILNMEVADIKKMI